MILVVKMDQKINADSSIKAKLEEMREETLAQLRALKGDFAGPQTFALAA